VATPESRRADVRTCGRSACVVLAALILSACGERSDQEVLNPQPEWIRRRTNVPFADAKPAPGETTLANSRQFQDIEQAMDAGEYARARALLDRYFAEPGAKHPRAHYLLGRLHSGRGEHEAAIPCYEHAVAGSPRWVEPRLALARTFLHLKRHAAAEGVFAEVDRLAPKSPWGPYGMGAVAYQRGASERAAALTDEALARDGEHVPSLRLRAELARIANDGVTEERLLVRSLQFEPSASAHQRLGEIAAGAGRAIDARRSFLAAWELSPTAATARRLGELASLRGDAVEARMWQSRAGIAPAAVPDPGPMP